MISMRSALRDFWPGAERTRKEGLDDGAEPPGGRSQKSDDLTLALAKKHHCSCLDLDKVKLQYDSYDLDKSGVIEYGEFELMMLKLLHVSNKSDLPQQLGLVCSVSSG
ncbi:hypothetical protein AK812_SmicGene44607 [Symbiodinium microadriaticum]|uniref:EF-hand domain-containing protein n=1 Tax=Symbiodinium microadriaticum TaxID=2951 RepID=A0A1Q9BY17_SYMMI|nr:hypothetical protein AK812_SmicGene44607 [Symbiodinium microadriaticum]